MFDDALFVRAQADALDRKAAAPLPDGMRYASEADYDDAAELAAAAALTGR